jgi:hypothetical protein
MKKMIPFFIFLSVAGLLPAKKIAALPEIGKPNYLVVDQTRVYVVEQLTVHAYSMENYKRISQFVKEGEGSQEAKTQIYLQTTPEKVAVTDMGKVMFFSPDGGYINEKRTSENISRIYPIGENFIGHFYNTDATKRIQYMSIELFDKDFNPIKTLCKGESQDLFSAPGGKKDMLITPNILAYRVCDGKIYVIDTQKGFSITVFDADGKELYEINKEYKKIAVPQSYQDKYFARYAKIPGLLEKQKKMFNYIFRDYWPAIYRHFVDNGKIYVFTYDTRREDENLERELVVLNLKGDILNRLFLPDKIFNSYVYKDTYYYLEDSPESGEWELHAVPLN